MRPSRAALIAATLWLLLGCAAAVWPVARPLFVFAGASLLLLGLSDALALLRYPRPTLERKLPPTLALGERYAVELRLLATRRMRCVLHDRPPHAGRAEGLPARVTAQPGRRLQVTYHFRPLARGRLTFERPSLELTGPLGLVERELMLGESQSVPVYPNFRRVAAYVAPGEESLYRGVHLQRRRGQGMEFYQLREYREGDSPRQVDWKSVARRQQLISREYRSEQNQNVIFLVDCGRRMRAHDGALSLLDQSLDALLLLSYVALRQGDSVGLLSFGGATRWLAPVRGSGGLRRVLDSVYDLESSAEPSDFEAAVALLAARQRRRALLVLLTNLGDDDLSALRDSLLPLQGKHLVLVASLRDPELTAQLRQELRSEQEALRTLSVLAYLDARHKARQKLAAAGVTTFESEPAALPQQLIERYLMIKRAGNL
jgi:uncharacterized protein (DUF58 family)